MKLALACVTGLAAASAAHAAPDQRAPRTSSFDLRQSTAADLWSFQQLPGARDSSQRLPSASHLQDLMDGLPLISDRSDGDERDKGFSFKVKPGKGVKAIARLRF